MVSNNLCGAWSSALFMHTGVALATGMGVVAPAGWVGVSVGLVVPGGTAAGMAGVEIPSLCRVVVVAVPDCEVSVGVAVNGGVGLAAAPVGGVEVVPVGWRLVSFPFPGSLGPTLGPPLLSVVPLVLELCGGVELLGPPLPSFTPSLSPSPSLWGRPSFPDPPTPCAWPPPLLPLPTPPLLLPFFPMGPFPFPLFCEFIQDLSIGGYVCGFPPLWVVSFLTPGVPLLCSCGRVSIPVCTGWGVHGPGVLGGSGLYGHAVPWGVFALWPCV